jgi:hypothetical protein
MVAVAVPVCSCEVGVNHTLLGRDTTSRVVDKKRVEEVKANVVESGDNACDVCAVPLGERGLEVGE